MYGKASDIQIWEEICYICDILGSGKYKQAPILIWGTLCAETQLGDYPQKKALSMGIAQIDEETFINIQLYVTGKKKLNEYIKTTIGLDIAEIKYNELKYNTFLSILFCRLFYMRIPEEIPIGVDKQAYYWKNYYNTMFGKGTVEHYIESFYRKTKNEFLSNYIGKYRGV